MPPAIIRAVSLSKIVQSGDEPLTILDSVAFDVPAGATIAIVGASGSGKTTLLGLLAGLDRPTSGDVVIDGIALSTLDQDGCAALRQRLLGFVFQSFQLLPALTALENVMLPLELAGAADAADRARSPGARRTIRGSCRAVSSSASPLRARSPASRRYSWRTNRPAISTAQRASRWPT